MQNYINSVTSTSGYAISGATVTVLKSDGTVPTLYAANGSSAYPSNVLTTDATGEYSFYAANGTYTIAVSAPNFTGQTNAGIVLYDPLDAPRVSITQLGGKGDGVTLDTAAVNAWLAGANSGLWVGVADPGKTFLTGQMVINHARLDVRGATFKFDPASVDASTDCVLLQSSSQASPIEIQGVLNLDANGAGRDLVRLTGGASSTDKTTQFMKLDGVNAVSMPVRDFIHIEPAGAFYWLEDNDLGRIGTKAGVGRHGIAAIMPDVATVFANKFNFKTINIRGCGKTTAGYDMFFDSLSTSYTAANSSEWSMDCVEFDASGGTFHAQGSIRFQRTGTVGGGHAGFAISNLTCEDTSGAIITGFPTVVSSDGLSTFNGFTVAGGVIAQYGQPFSSADITRHPNLMWVQGSGSKNLIRIDGLIYGNGVVPGNTAIADTSTLDWYEEGTFTPAITLGGAAVGVTYALQEGTFTRIGNRVTFSAIVTLTSKGSSVGSLVVTGLPYNTTNTTAIPMSAYCNTMAAGVGAVQAMNNASGTNTLRIFKFAAGVATQLADTDLTNTSDLRITGTYKA